MYNNHHHSGYTPKQLYIGPKYQDFQEEIGEYKDITFSDYQSVILPKVNQYLTTNKVKQTTNEPPLFVNDYIPLYYGVKEYSSISFNHLLSVTLYTDFTALCSSFSSTFRAISKYESFDSIKLRNQKYYWMSRYLRETVQLFGTHGDYRELKGPFFSGLSYKLVFPEFVLRLSSPTSTSYNLEVALNFTNDKQGLIVKLNNTVPLHNHLRGFSCSWLSAYKEESECLFFGGHYRIKIETVTIMETKRNYKTFFKALEKVNKIFNGKYICQLEDDRLSNKDRLFFSFLLFGVVLDKKDISSLKIDKYIKDTITSFKKNKTQIILNIDFLYRLNDKEMNDKIMNKMVEYKYDEVDGLSVCDSINLFCKDIFKIFDNLKTIILITTSQYGDYQYVFSFIYLLSIICESSTLTNIEIKAIRYRNEPSWLSCLWSSSSSYLIELYKQKNLNIKMMETTRTGYSFFLEDRILICRY